MDNEAKRNAAPATLDHLLGHAVGDLRERYIKAIHRKSLTFKYADVMTNEPGVAKITPGDVVGYYWNYHGSHEFEASVRRLESTMLGDWRPIDELAQMCLEWFKVSCRDELIATAATYGMTLLT